MKTYKWLLAGALIAASFAQAPPDPAKAPIAQPVTVQPGVEAKIDKNEPEIATHDTPSTFSTRVNLVAVPVVVRDRNGRAVGNLVRGDFQLFDKGKPQDISRFSMENAGEKAANQAARMKEAAQAAGEPFDVMPTRFVAYVFDDTHLGAADLLQAREATRKHLRESLPATDRAAVFTTSGTVTLDFTGDHAALDEAILKILPRPSVTEVTTFECPPVTYYQADQIAKGDQQAFNAAVSDAFICGNLPPPPVGTATAQMMAQGAAARVTARAEHDTTTTISSLTAILTRMSSTPGQRLMILISPGFYVTNDMRGMASTIADKALRSNVSMSTIDARGLYTVISGGDASTPSNNFNASTQMLKNRYATESQSIEGDILGEFAEGTGGTWFHNNNDLPAGLKQASVLPEYQYILGFSPQNLRYDGGFHALKVVVKGKEYTLQARRGYYAPRHAPDEAEQAKEEIREAFFSRDEIVDIPITLQTQFFKPTADIAKISVVSHVDMKQMRFKKVDGRNLNTMTIVTGLFDRNGNMIDGLVKTIDFKFKDENLAARMAAGVSTKMSFDAPPGKYVVRLVVRDSEGQTMAAKNGVVEVP